MRLARERPAGVACRGEDLPFGALAATGGVLLAPSYFMIVAHRLSATDLSYTFLSVGKEGVSINQLIQ